MHSNQMYFWAKGLAIGPDYFRMIATASFVKPTNFQRIYKNLCCTDHIPIYSRPLITLSDDTVNIVVTSKWTISLQISVTDLLHLKVYCYLELVPAHPIYPLLDPITPICVITLSTPRCSQFYTTGDLRLHLTQVGSTPLSRGNSDNSNTQCLSAYLRPTY